MCFVWYVMGLFRKKKKWVDLGERQVRSQEKLDTIKQEIAEEKKEPENSGGIFSIFGGATQSVDSSAESSGVREESLEKKRKLAKRLSDMTNKIEDLSNQIYHLQQRIEVVERKSDVGRF
ncbi:hypothetical protein ACFL0X_01385 [Nanoarchaeota archaeon]